MFSFPSPPTPAVTKPKYTLFLEHSAAILPPLIAQAVPAAQNTLASFSLHFEIPSDLKASATFFFFSLLLSHIHSVLLLRQQTVPAPLQCVRPFAGDTAEIKTHLMELSGPGRGQTPPPGCDSSEWSGWDRGSPEGCGNAEEVTGQTWGIREGFLKEGACELRPS